MSEPFTRTPTGLAGKWHFHDVPTLWVEGPTDVFFFEPLTSDLKCRIESFHGKKNAEALLLGIKEYNHPYCVVLDGDYSILHPGRSASRKIVVLKKYSFENYLWDKTVINRACLRHAQCGERGDVVSQEVDQAVQHLKQTLFDLVVMDVASENASPSLKVLPDRIEQLLVREDSIQIDASKVDRLLRLCCGIDVGLSNAAKAKILEFLKDNEFTDLLRGHLLFGVLRRLFTQAVAKIKGKKSILSDDALMQILSEIVWKNVPSGEHRRLRRKLRSVIRELEGAYPGA